jgi:hypothetical protein
MKRFSYLTPKETILEEGERIVGIKGRHPKEGETRFFDF